MTATATRQLVFTAVFHAFAATVKDLVADTGLSEATVRKALKDLAAGGHVESTDVNGEAQGSSRRGQFKEIVWQASNISIDDSDEDDLAAYVAARLTDPTTTTKESTTMSDATAPFPAHTAPSGKVTKWGIPGSDETFKSKYDAQKAMAAAPALATEEPAAEPAEAEKPAKAKAAKAEAAPAVTLDMGDILPEGAELGGPASGAYVTVKVNGKSIGYITPRKRGTLLVEVLTSRLDEAAKADLKGTKPRQNQTSLIVKDDKAMDQARRLFAVAAASVAEVAK